MNEIVINWGIVTTLSVLLGFVINQVLAYFGVRLSVQVKKSVVFAVAVAASAYFASTGGYELPPLGDDPAIYALALLSLATSAFKVAQLVYDRLWQELIAA